jgi:hypothetical protein
MLTVAGTKYMSAADCAGVTVSVGAVSLAVKMLHRMMNSMILSLQGSDDSKCRVYRFK